jgi:hypothetical protein
MKHRNLRILFVIFVSLATSHLSFANDSAIVYQRRAITVFCNEISVVLRKVGGDFTESWMDSDKNEWFNYTDVFGKVAILIKPADKPETLCIVNMGKIRNVKPLSDNELPK